MDKKTRTQLGERIKEARNNIGFTQDEASEMLEIAYSSYVKIENGFQSPSLDLLIKISEFYSVTIDYLIYGNNKIEFNQSDKINTLIKVIDKDKLKHTNIIISKILDLL